MTDTEDRFERQVADVANRTVGPERYVDALAVTRRAMTPTPRWRLGPSLLGLAGATAAFAFIVLGGVVLWGLMLTDDVEPRPAGSPSPSASASASGVPIFGFGAVTPVADDRRRFTSAARSASGEIVVVGVGRRSQGGPGLPTAWTSHDEGATWSEASLALGTTGEATEVVATDAGFVVIARGDNRANRNVSGVWASADGLGWEELAILPDALLMSLLVVPDGLAATGVEFREAQGHADPAAYPTIWISADGREWQAHEISAPWHEPGEDVLVTVGIEGHIGDLPLDIARSDAGVWMVSGIDRDTSAGTDPLALAERPAVWVGSPGGAWAPAGPPVAEPDVAGRFDVITWRPGGFIVKGEVRDETGASSFGIWSTPDGRNWEQVIDLGPGAPLEVATASDELIAVIRPPVDWDFGGASYPVFSDIYRGVLDDDHPWALRPDRLTDEAQMLLSRDGRTWSQADPLEGFPLAARFGADGSLIVVGSDPTGCDRWWCAYESTYGGEPKIWIGSVAATPTQARPPSGGTEG